MFILIISIIIIAVITVSLMIISAKKEKGAAVNLTDDAGMIDGTILIQAIIKSEKKKYDEIRRKMTKREARRNTYKKRKSGGN